ncbi:hypothetical protein LCGC14_1797370 [marine sediment metagenome]|uniref:Uncharacterized protein n=1 Tax=marine sediment metagenome TaxID=412755 RepID=A0A0F9J5F6_9ZZZZ
MNTYRITVTTTCDLNESTQMRQFDVDAHRSNTAIICVLNKLSTSFFERDLINITSQLYARDISPLNKEKVRPITTDS